MRAARAAADRARAARARRASPGSTRWRARSPARAATSTRIRTPRPPRELGPNGELAAELHRDDGSDRRAADAADPRRAPSSRWSARPAATSRPASSTTLAPAIASPSWGIARVALAACEFRTDDESGIPVSAARARRRGRDPRPHRGRDRTPRRRSRASARCASATTRSSRSIRRRRSGSRYAAEEFERAYAERDRRPHRPSAIM